MISDDKDDLIKELGQMMKDSMNRMTQEEIDEYSKPFGVVIAEDCRLQQYVGQEGNLTDYFGVCLGYYGYNEDFTKLEELEKIIGIEQISSRSLNPPHVYPLFFVPKAGTYLWGIECYWIAITEIPDLLDIAKSLEEEKTKGKDPFLDEVLRQ